MPQIRNGRSAQTAPPSPRATGGAILNWLAAMAATRTTMAPAPRKDDPSKGSHR